MKKVLSVLRIEAHDIGWQHVHREIRRELWNVFAVMLRKTVLVIACHEVSTLLPQLRPASARRILRLPNARAPAFLDLALLGKLGHPLVRHVHA
jgi:hypothetical protein